MRKSTAFILFTVFCSALLSILMLHAGLSRGDEERTLRPCTDIAKALQLTDLCIFTEARYTRHPAMADFQSAFQDHPLALEHFPSGSLVAPPRFHPEVP